MATALRPTTTDPSYQTRQSAFLGPLTAGSGGTTVNKFVAHANLLLFDITTYQVTAGTSTYTNTVTGVGTSVINGQQVSIIVITNANAFTTNTASLGTATYGPFLAGGSFASGGTGTGQIGGANQYALNTSTGTTGYGGIPIPAGAQFYAVSGTDATAVNLVTVGYQINTSAGLTL